MKTTNAYPSARPGSRVFELGPEAGLIGTLQSKTAGDVGCGIF